MKKRYLILVLAFVWESISAQSNILQTYINQGLESNLSLKQENLELQKALKSMFTKSLSKIILYFIIGV